MVPHFWSYHSLRLQMPSVQVQVRLRLHMVMGCLQVEEENWCSHYVQLLKLNLKIPYRVWYKPLPLQILKCGPCKKQKWKDLVMTGLQLLTDQFNTYIEDADQVKAEWPLLQSAVFDVYVKKCCIWCLFPHFSVYLETFLILEYLSPFIFSFSFSTKFESVTWA